MTEKGTQRETDLIDSAVAWLRARLPERWALDVHIDEGADTSSQADVWIDVRSDHGAATRLTVEARSRLEPRDVERLFGSVTRKLRKLSPHLPILVLAPWLSERTRALLEAERINYIDLTGNALVRLDNPAAFIQTRGATRDPSPTPRGKARVRGPKAGRLIRMLVDARPPYGVSELADATALTPGYTSRLLDTLDGEALIERAARGRVESVDVAGLLRRWAETYDVFGANDAATFLAPRGAATALSELPSAGRTAVTGSFAAVRLAAVAGPALLCVYCDDVSTTADALDLIPTDQGANVALLRPFDSVVWARTDNQPQARYVAPSQVAVDCLTGNGRMPSEGEALLNWMLANESQWRMDGLVESETGA